MIALFPTLYAWILSAHCSEGKGVLRVHIIRIFPFFSPRFRSQPWLGQIVACNMYIRSYLDMRGALTLGNHGLTKGKGANGLK